MLSRSRAWVVQLSGFQFVGRSCILYLSIYLSFHSHKHALIPPSLVLVSTHAAHCSPIFYSRQSNQRCFVVHGSHNLIVEDNVSYDTAGHCVLLEEGSEENNHFTHNLIVRVKIPAVKINPSDTDNDPAAFWITNANNHL